MSKDAKPTIAVLTTFNDLPSGYGLVPVTLSQLRMLVDNGYEPHLFVQTRHNAKQFKERLPKGVVFKPLVPFIHLFEYGPNSLPETHKVDAVGEHGRPNKTNFDKQLKLMYNGLEPLLKEYSHIITHDIIFQTWFVVHNAAIRKIAEKHPEIKWIHWLHSGPSARPPTLKYPGSLRFTGMPNSTYISPNESMIPKFAEMYNIPRQYLKVVYNTIDLQKFYDLHPLSVELINKHKLLAPDILCVWATRIDHLIGKGLLWPVRLVAQMNKLVHAKMLYCNSWSSGTREKNNIRKMRDTATKWALPQENLIFTSEMGKQWVDGVPQKVVRDMYWIGNLFIMPSISETFSLAMAEAAVCKNMLVLNDDLTVFHELAGDDATYVGFGSVWGGDTTTRDYKPNAELFFMARAKELVAELQANKTLQMHRRVLRRFNRDWVWKHQVRPLIEGGNE